MNREKKFRAWMDEAKCMVYFDLFTKPENVFSSDPTMEYVGQIDRNGQETYEGDLIQAVLQEFNEPPRTVIEEVIISDDGFLAPFFMRVSYEEDWWKDCLVDGFEIIGHIYETA